MADLQRYVDVTRGEIFFSRGVILVEGDAERFLIPAFAEVLDISLDELRVTVCSVSGVNFAPYVKLLGDNGLQIPFVVITDRDPVEPNKSLGVPRLKKLLQLITPEVEFADLSTSGVLSLGRESGIFLNSSTLEVELFINGLEEEMQVILENELNLSTATKETLATWVEEPSDVDAEKLLKLIDRVGKGRFAQRLAEQVTICPDYIRKALERIRDAVS